MKALSVRQPWCHAIVRLGKRVENRDWEGCSFRGPVLLHASKTLVLRPRKGEPETFGDACAAIVDIEKPCVSDERDDLLDPMCRWDAKHGLWRPAPALTFGGIVGRARVAGVVYGDAGIRELERLDPDDRSRLWYAGGFALVLADVEPLPFIPWRGSLGFFDVPDAVVRAAFEREQERLDGARGPC